jgi:protocatechuate 3,4-dioxygenase beta subunit
VVMTAVFVAWVLSAAGPQLMPPPPPPRPVQGQVRDPGRRPPPEPVGTARIRGRVVTADTGAPIRRAQVNLSMSAPAVAPPAGGSAAAPGTATQVVTVNGITTTINTTVQAGFARPKSVTTDAQGVFEFKDLPAGSYRVTASPGQYSGGYLGIAYGATKPNGAGVFDPGTPIQVADGQAFDKATIALPRGAVITGRVVDENGDPLARVQVYTLMYASGSNRSSRNGVGASTDDLGQFRLFGLAPADYVVVAEARGNTFVPPNAPPETEEDKIGYLTTYFPMAVDEASAQRVRTKAGVETPGVEIRVVTGRLFHVTGMVTDSQGRPAMRANGSLMKRTSGGGFTSSFGFSSDEQGRFQMRNIPPGDYRLTVRQQTSPLTPRNADGSIAEQPEFASVPLNLTTDVDDVLIATGPGVTITGTVVLEGGPPPPMANGAAPPMRVITQVGDPDSMFGMPTPQPALVSPDLTFTLKGLTGELLLRGAVANMFLKQVQLGGEDITDTPHAFKTGDRVTIVLTARAGIVEGNVTDATGKATSDASLIMFSDDKAAWRSNSIRTRRAGPNADGHFRIQGVLPGRYYIVALPRDRMNGITIGSDPAVFEQLSKEATTLVVGEDEQRQVDVRVSGGGA